MNLTIMIATKNRPGFLARAIQYYSISGYKGIISIGDSSSVENSKENLKTIKNYQNLKIDYYRNIHVSADQMMSFLSKKVKTKFSVMINDDDVLIVPSIQKCINFLDKNLDFSAVNGRAYTIGLNKNDCISHGKITFFQNYSLPEYKSDKLIKRISDFFYKTLNVNMSITRSDINMRAFNNVKRLNKFDSAFVFGELIHAVTILSNGKIANLKDCYLVRQKHSEQYYRKINRLEWFNKSNIVSAIFELQKIIKIELLKKNVKFNQKLENKINEFILIKVKYIFQRFSKDDNNILILIKMILKFVIKFFYLAKSYFFNPVEKFFCINEKHLLKDENKLRQYFDLVEK